MEPGRYEVVTNSAWYSVRQNNTFPERGTVYDYFFLKKGSGIWVEWMDGSDKSASEIPATAQVTHHTSNMRNSYL